MSLSQQPAKMSVAGVELSGEVVLGAVVVSVGDEVLHRARDVRGAAGPRYMCVVFCDYFVVVSIDGGSQMIVELHGERHPNWRTNTDIHSHPPHHSSTIRYEDMAIIRGISTYGGDLGGELYGISEIVSRFDCASCCEILGSAVLRGKSARVSRMKVWGFAERSCKF